MAPELERFANVQLAVSGADPSTAPRRRLGPEQGEVEHRVPPQRELPVITIPVFYPEITRPAIASLEQGGDTKPAKSQV